MYDANAECHMLNTILSHFQMLCSYIKSVMLAAGPWTKEEKKIFDDTYTDHSVMPSSRMMADLCKASPKRQRLAIRTRASNIKLGKVKA